MNPVSPAFVELLITACRELESQAVPILALVAAWAAAMWVVSKRSEARGYRAP